MKLATKIKLYTIAILSVFALTLWLSNSATPNSPTLYQFKRLQEKIFMAVKSKPEARVKYYSTLLDERLNELRSLVENRQTEYILTASLRYSTTAGLLTEIIKTHNLADAVAITQEKFKRHQKVIKDLDDSYPKDEDEQWKFVQDDYNYLAIYSQQLSDIFSQESQSK